MTRKHLGPFGRGICLVFNALYKARFRQCLSTAEAMRTASLEVSRADACEGATIIRSIEPDS
jgi:hypothetical protein